MINLIFIGLLLGMAAIHASQGDWTAMSLDFAFIGYIIVSIRCNQLQKRIAELEKKGDGWRR